MLGSFLSRPLDLALELGPQEMLEGDNISLSDTEFVRKGFKLLSHRLSEREWIYYHNRATGRNRAGNLT